jgi:uncharacterized Zn-finger protein
MKSPSNQELSQFITESSSVHIKIPPDKAMDKLPLAFLSAPGAKSTFFSPGIRSPIFSSQPVFPVGYFKPQAVAPGSNVKKHACQFCHKAFKNRQHLVNHERTHTGERPHKCTICGRGFTQKQAQLRHEFTHYTCYNKYM